MRLEVATGANEELVRRIIVEESLRTATQREPDAYDEVYHVPGPVDLTGLMDLVGVPNRDYLRDPPFTPASAAGAALAPGR